MKSASWIVAALFLTMAGTALAAGGTASAITVGVQQRVLHEDFEELPFSDDDLSYLLAYEFHEYSSFWQIGVTYTPEVENGTNEISSVVTPQLHLLYNYRETLWGGMGLLKTFINSDDSYWTDIYWQAQLGLQIPIARTFKIRVGAYLIYEDFGEFFDFDMDEVELAASINYSF